jgi:hypothetical protein
LGVKFDCNSYKSLLDCVSEFINCNLISAETRFQTQRLKLILEKEIAGFKSDVANAA